MQSTEERYFGKETRCSTWKYGLFFLLLLCLGSRGSPVARTSAQGLASPNYDIEVGPYNVSVYPSLMPAGLYSAHPEAQGHPVVESFVSSFNPIWAVDGVYYNESVGAPTHVAAVLVVALNQSGFWQLVFSANGTIPLDIRWTCTISGDRMPVNASAILLTAIERLLNRLPEESVRLYRFYLAAIGWGDDAVNAYSWRLYFAVQTKPWVSFSVEIATNGTVLSEELLAPPGGTFLPLGVLLALAVAAVGTVVLVAVVVGFARTHSTLSRWHRE
jgi:hypothetical protein